METLKEIERKCLWCGKEAKDSPQDICWDCIYGENLTDIYKSLTAKLIGSIKSKRKANSSRRNGKLGGRPKKKKKSESEVIRSLIEKV